MKRACIAVLGVVLGGCGPSYGGQDVKTPDQLIDDQEQMAAQEEQEKKKRGTDDISYSAEETDAEKKRKFDRKQVDMELKRATRSAESCPGVVVEQEKTEKKEHPRGDTRVSVTFQEDGTVRQVSIPSPFDGTPLGECVVRAYKAVIVPPYTEGEQIVDVDVSLKDAKEETKGKGKKK